MKLKFLPILVTVLFLAGCSSWNDEAFKNDFGGVPIIQETERTYLVGEVSSENFRLLGDAYRVPESSFKEGLEKALKVDGLSATNSNATHYRIDVTINSIVPDMAEPWNELTIKLVADYYVRSEDDTILLYTKHVETSSTSPALAGGSFWKGLLLTSPQDINNRALSTSTKAAHDNIVEFVKSLKQSNMKPPSHQIIAMPPLTCRVCPVT